MTNPDNARPGEAADLINLNNAVRALFSGAQRILITSHIRPDGDAVGSALGLGLALEQAGKTVRIALADGLPHVFRYLEGSQKVTRGAPSQNGSGGLDQYDLLVVVDSSDLPRVGGVLGEREPHLNIDHHITNLRFARTNLVLPDFVATAAIIGTYLPDWGLRYNSAIASALLTGLITDTIGFRTSNMTPQALRLAADLMELGANLPLLYERALVTKTFEAARYWSYGLGRIQSETVNNHPEDEDAGYGLVWTSLTLADRAAADYPGNDDADLVNVLSSIDLDVAVIFVEQKNGHVKVSWRARPGIDVSKIALQFGGGGHPAASGADITGTLAEVQGQVLAATRALLAQVAQKNQNGKKTK